MPAHFTPVKAASGSDSINTVWQRLHASAEHHSGRLRGASSKHSVSDETSSTDEASALSLHGRVFSRPRSASTRPAGQRRSLTARPRSLSKLPAKPAFKFAQTLGAASCTASGAALLYDVAPALSDDSCGSPVHKLLAPAPAHTLSSPVAAAATAPVKPASTQRKESLPGAASDHIHQPRQHRAAHSQMYDSLEQSQQPHGSRLDEVEAPDSVPLLQPMPLRTIDSAMQYTVADEICPASQPPGSQADEIAVATRTAADPSLRSTALDSELSGITGVPPPTFEGLRAVKVDKATMARIERMRTAVYGHDAVFETPFGPKHMVYAGARSDHEVYMRTSQDGDSTAWQVLVRLRRPCVSGRCAAMHTHRGLC